MQILGSILQPVLDSLPADLRIFIRAFLRGLESLAGEDPVVCLPVQEVLFSLTNRVFDTIQTLIADTAADVKKVAEDTKLLPDSAKRALLNFAMELQDAAGQIPIEVNIQVSSRNEA